MPATRRPAAPTAGRPTPRAAARSSPRSALDAMRVVADGLSGSARRRRQGRVAVPRRRRCRARRSPTGCRARSTTRSRPCRSRRSCSTSSPTAGPASSSSARRTAWSRCTASEVVPVTALGLDAGRTTQGHRFEAKRPPIELRDAGSYAAQLRDEGAVIAGFAERRAEIVRQLRRRRRRRRARVELDDDAPARRGDGAGRAAERARLRVRARVPRGAGRVPGPDDEGEPEVLSAARRRPAR